jgi:hypothetical protein
MKKLLMALVVAAPVALGLSGVNGAEASTNMKIYLGMPHYSYQVGPDYVYRRDYGWYRPGHVNRLSCGEARRIVRNRGYRAIVARQLQRRNLCVWRRSQQSDRHRLCECPHRGCLARMNHRRNPLGQSGFLFFSGQLSSVADSFPSPIL